MTQGMRSLGLILFLFFLASAWAQDTAANALQIPSLSYGPSDWSIVRIKNPSPAAREVRIEIYRSTGERLRMRPEFNLQPLDTLEVIIEPRQISAYRRDGRQKRGLNPPRELEAALENAIDKEGAVWMRVSEPPEHPSEPLDINASVEIHRGKEVVSFERLPKEAIELNRWLVRTSVVRGNDLYLLNTSDRKTTISVCLTNQNNLPTCPPDKPSTAKMEVNPNQAVVLHMDKARGRYLFIRSSNPGKAILSLFTSGVGTRRVFASESSISFEQ